MKIVTTTLSNGNESIIADALFSVQPFADINLIIDNGIRDRTLEIAKSICGPDLAVALNDGSKAFGDWRNLALAEASKLGDWGCMLDTDERMICNGYDIRAYLEGLPDTVETVLVMEDTGKYCKERFFRLPIKGEFRGVKAHEEFKPVGGAVMMPRVRFSELPKSKEALDRRLERDLVNLMAQRLDDPTHPRWPYYIGATYENLNQPTHAVNAYRECAAMEGAEETRAWACYRAAVCLSATGFKEDAIEECGKGIVIHPGVAELRFLAGALSLELGRFDDAIAWAYMAIPGGHGSRAASLRWGFRGPQGLFEGPYEVLEAAYRALGAPAEMLEAIHADVERRTREREAWQAGEVV